MHEKNEINFEWPEIECNRFSLSMYFSININIAINILCWKLGRLGLRTKNQKLMGLQNEFKVTLPTSCLKTKIRY